MTQTALTDDVWTTAAADESATAASDETTREDDDHEYPQTKQALCERAEAHATDVAAEYFPALCVDLITWETSTRMQRSAGVAIYDHQSAEITIRLSWDAYKAYGWEQFARVVRLELIHAWQYHEHGEADHGPTFRWWIEPLETDRHCEQYTEPKYWVMCEECESRVPRYQRSKVVQQPKQYSCRQCDGDILIETT